jgi:proteasome accessory factor A
MRHKLYHKGAAMKEKSTQGPIPAREPTPTRLPKLCGADIELGNFILGLERRGSTGYEASRALLREIEGLPRTPSYPYSYGGGYFGSSAGYYSGGSGYGYNPQDWGRKYLSTNGGCVYIDLDHLELCLPEVTGAYDHVAAWHAMLRIARQALMAANAKLPPGQKIQVLVNNSDGQGNSYGSHVNFLITRRAWENLFKRKIYPMLYLAACQVSSIVCTGQGKVGAENGAPPVEFQLSQRADFFETLTGEQTTFNRPLVNSRDEALCGHSRYGTLGGRATGDMARLHCIFFDNTLCHVASLLKVGVMQIVLAMIEAERINLNLILDDPLDAVVRWSHDPTLQARARMTSGREPTAVELQLLFLEEAKRFVEAGGCDERVPRAGEILALWEDTLLKLQKGDFAALAPRLDWVLKLGILQRAMKQHPDLTWNSPQIKHLDHLYSSLDPSEGLYWAYENSGLVERIVTEAQIEQFVHGPPEDTRAWTRAMLLRKAGPDLVDGVDWDWVRFKKGGSYWWPTYRTLDLANPLAFTKTETERIFQETTTLDATLDALGAPQTDTYAARTPQWQSDRIYQNPKGGTHYETS